MATIVSVALLPRRARADALPAQIQADLLVKIAPYDRNIRLRADTRVRVLILRASDPLSERWAAQIGNSLARVDTIAGLPHSETIAIYRDPTDLAAVCRTERITIVVLPPEVRNDVDKIRSALEGVNVLSVTPDAELVQRGIVLGFELVSGKPKLFFNLRQAQRQGIAMSAELLKLMTVYQ
jgi:hypothetical protein